MDTNHTNAIIADSTTDGGSTDTEQLARDGAYFLKRDRNKARTISIYTCKPVTSQRGKTFNQSVAVVKTGTSDPKLAEIALKRFTLNDREAKQKERERQVQGKSAPQAIDRPVVEALNLYYLGHAEAKGGGVATAVRNTIENVRCAWPDNPYCSTLTRDKQKEFVEYMRAQGYSDNTTASQFSYVWSAMNWCDAEGKLAKFPARIGHEEWDANLESSKLPAYELDELAALFVEARKEPAHWRFMVCATATGSRPGAILELTHKQLQLQRRLCKLNPDGRRQTKKRRATVPMCPTFFAEAASWERSGDLVIGLETQSFYEHLSDRVGIPGSSMRIRKTVRTWLAEQRVLDAMADIFVGHAEEGSSTGRRWYKHLKPEYLLECAEAVEKLFQEIERRTGIPFAGSRTLTLPNQPLPDDDFARFLTHRVTTTWQVNGGQTMLVPPMSLPVQSLPAHA